MSGVLVSAKVSSRLRIFLSPFGFTIPPNAPQLITMSWRQFATLTVDGIVEPHYLGTRLHHYEIIARAV